MVNVHPHPPENVQEILESLASKVHVPAGEFLFHQSQQQSSLFVLQSGMLQLAVYVPGRGDIPILTLGPNELVAWSALLGKLPMTCSAKAIEDSVLLQIPVESIEQSALQNPLFGKELYRWVALGLAQRLTATRLQLLDLFQHPNA